MIHRKINLPESLCNNVANLLQPAIFIINMRILQKCFPVKIAKFYKNIFFSRKHCRATTSAFFNEFYVAVNMNSLSGERHNSHGQNC